MNFSSHQIAIFNFIENDSRSVIVDAKAGSGKTTSIVEATRRLDSNLAVLFLAFNKSIVNELNDRLPSGVKCSTFNAIGYGAWRRYTGRKYIKIESDKIRKIIRDNFTNDDFTLYSSFCGKMVALAKSAGLRPDDSYQDWSALSIHHSLILDSDKAEYPRAIELSKKILDYSIKIAYDICDFDDQIYMPWLTGASFDKYDVVFVDEAQDTNKIQAELISRMIGDNGRIIAVGDPGQAIYGFRGADSAAMNNIADTFGAVTLPLSISYRCSKSIIAEAQKYVPEIEAFSGADNGTVEQVSKYTIDSFNSSDAILCRNVAPLIEIAYQIISRGKKINFVGRDLASGLKSLIEKMKAENVNDLSVKLDEWLSKESKRLIEKDQESKIEIVADRVQCIETFIEYLPMGKERISDLLNAIDFLFKTDDSGITLTSVHKSKGREWNRVFILGFAKYMPSKYAKSEWQMQQERNLIYVAITRARKCLYYICENEWADEPNMRIDESAYSSHAKNASQVKSLDSSRYPAKNNEHMAAFISRFN